MMKQDDTPKWLREHQVMYPDKPPIQKQIDDLKARVDELERLLYGRKNSTF